MTHGKAKRVEIRLGAKGGEGLLTVLDNGVGIPESLRPPDGIGLHNMAYRARLIGGRIEVRRRSRGGTKVLCAFPLCCRLMSARNRSMPAPAKRTILIVDDHPMFRRGLASLIESEPDLAVCGQAGNSTAALQAVQQSQPDLVIVDLALGESDGLDLVKEMKRRHPGIPTLVLSMHDEAVYAERSLRAGARGYVTKQQLDETVLVAIRRLLAGETYMSGTLEERLAARYVAGRTLATDSPLEALSDRELQVFRLIGQGRSTRQIAETLHLSIKTIETHREHIKQKLMVGSATELAHRATQWVETGRPR